MPKFVNKRVFLLTEHALIHEFSPAALDIKIDITYN